MAWLYIALSGGGGRKIKGRKSRQEIKKKEWDLRTSEEAESTWRGKDQAASRRQASSWQQKITISKHVIRTIAVDQFSPFAASLSPSIRRTNRHPHQR